MFQLNVGKSCFKSKNKLYEIKFDDYSVIADFCIEDFKELFPKELKPKLGLNWYYHMHVPPLRIQRHHLQKRVIGGGILAYQFSDDLSISGNNVVYFGFLPTVCQNFDDSFKSITKETESVPSEIVFDEPNKHKCLVSAQKVWPRKLYIYLRRVASCACGEDCLCVEIENRDRRKQNYCLKSIDWTKIYIIMGDLDEMCREGAKESRTCTICANCFNCSKSVDYCKSHKVCKHTVSAVNGSKLVMSEFKKCKKN